MLCYRPLCFSYVNANWLVQEQLDLHNKSSEVCIKTRSTPASLPFRGQVTKPATKNWSILVGFVWAVSADVNYF